MVKYYVTGIDYLRTGARHKIYQRPFNNQKEAEKYLQEAKEKYSDEYDDIKIVKNFRWKPSFQGGNK